MFGHFVVAHDQMSLAESLTHFKDLFLWLLIIYLAAVIYSSLFPYSDLMLGLPLFGNTHSFSSSDFQTFF